MPKFMDLELAKAAYKLVHDEIMLKKGESVLITIDSVSDFRVAEEIAKMCEALGGKVMVAWHSTPVGYGALTMPYLPDPLIAAAPNTDVWIELNDQWLLYSPIWDKAVTNGRTRQIMLGGLGIERIVRCIGKVDIDIQKEFQNHLTEITKKAEEIRIVNKAGTDVVFKMKKGRPVNNEIIYTAPGGHFLLGQIGWAPDEDTINGTIAFDAAVSGGGEAEFNSLSKAIVYTVEKGRITKISGGAEAEILRNYFKKLDDPNMYIAAHVCYGCNPCAELGTVTTENERIWGSTQWGFGHQGSNYSGGAPREAKSHIDGICLDCTIWLDGEMIEDNGVYIEPRLAELAKKLGK